MNLEDKNNDWEEQLKQLKRKKWRIVLIFFVLFEAGILLGLKTGSMLCIIIGIFSFFICISYIFIKPAYLSSVYREEIILKKNQERFIINIEYIRKKRGASKVTYVDWDRMNVTHIEGLPIASGIGCEIYNREGYYEINGAGFTFRLDMDEITDFSLSYRTYSVTTKISETNHYIVLTYMKNGSICWIRLQYKSSGERKVKEWKTLFDYEKSLKENNSFNNENTYHI